jgi:hypothetical protein
MLLVTRLVVAVVRELLEPTVLQELLLKLVMAVLVLSAQLQLLLFIMLVAVVAEVLMLADCCLTPVRVGQAVAVRAVLVQPGHLSAER